LPSLPRRGGRITDLTIRNRVTGDFATQQTD
jgi:hypothetical protein